MFYFLEDFDIANNADDSTPYCADKSAAFFVSNLKQSSKILFEWLNNNYMNLNTGKSHLLLSGNSRATATIDNSYTELEDEQLILTLLLKTISTIFARKQVQKINALAKIAPNGNKLLVGALVC